MQVPRHRGTTLQFLSITFRFINSTYLLIHGIYQRKRKIKVSNLSIWKRVIQHWRQHFSKSLEKTSKNRFPDVFIIGSIEREQYERRVTHESLALMEHEQALPAYINLPFNNKPALLCFGITRREKQGYFFSILIRLTVHQLCIEPFCIP